MAYDEGSAERIRECLMAYDVKERKMFGGLAFMVQGHMTVGLLGDELMLRVGKAYYDEALRQDFVRKMDFTGKPMSGYVLLEPEGYSEDEELSAWIEHALSFTLSLEPK